MNARSRRPLSLTNLRAFEAVARTLSFGAAADELHVTQSAISRQIKGLEDELGAPLFVRGTRHVQITPDGQTLLRAVEPLLAKLDASVQHIRRSRSRQRVSVTTFASFGSLWLLPRIEAFQRSHPDIDIRVSAHDALDDLDDPELDLALRYLQPGAGAGRRRAPVRRDADAGGQPQPLGADQARRGAAAGRAGRPGRATRCSRRTTTAPSTEFLSWRHWLACHDQPALEPRRWLYLNFTYQQVQAALAGHGVALARVPLVFEALQRGELVEPFGEAGRIDEPVLVLDAGRAGQPRAARGDAVHAPGSRPRRRRRATRSAPSAPAC